MVRIEKTQKNIVFIRRTIRRLLLTLLVVTLVLPVGTSNATSTPSQELFQMSNQYAGPTDIVLGSDGNMWYGENNASEISRITPSGVITSYHVNSYSAYGASIRGLQAGPDGAIWFIDANTDQIGKITTNGQITKFTAPLLNQNGLEGLAGMTFGPDGNIWFTLAYSNKVGRMTTSGVWNTYSLPTTNANAWPYGITLGADGNLWFTELMANKIGRITTDGQITEYPTGKTNVRPTRITAGSDNAVWFTDTASGLIGRMTATGQSTFLTPPYGPISYPSSIIDGNDGAIWYTSQAGEEEYIGRITTSGEFTRYELPYEPQGFNVPYSIAFQNDNTIWITLFSHAKIMKMTIPDSVQPPENLVAVSPTKYPNLSWSDTANVQSYNIYRDGLYIATTQYLSYIDTVAPEGTHVYTVTAIQNGTESLQSNIISVFVDRTRPSITFTTPISFDNTYSNGPQVTVVASDNSDTLSALVIHLYSSTGQLLNVCGSASQAQLLTKTMSCNLASIATGSYYIKAGTNDIAGNNKTIVSPIFSIIGQ